VINLNSLIINKQAEIKNKENESIVPKIIGGVSLIAAGKYLHEINSALKHEDSLKNIETMFKEIKKNPKPIKSVKIPEGVSVIRNATDKQKYLNTYQDYIAPEKVQLKDLWKNTTEAFRKPTASTLADVASQSDGMFVATRKIPGWKHPTEQDYVKPFVFVPEKHIETGGQILEHELGHFDQYQKGDIESYLSLKNRAKGYVKSIYNPKKDSIYQMEADAWRRAGYSEDDSVARHALKTYENNARLNRTHLLKNIAGITGLGVAGKAIYDYNHTLNNKKKNASIALDRYRKILDAGYLYEGNAKKFLYRNILKGKTPEEIGFINLTRKDRESIARLSSKGKEYGIDISRDFGRETSKGEIGAVINNRLSKSLKEEGNFDNLENILNQYKHNLQKTFHIV